MRDASRSRIDPRAGYVNASKVTACRECGAERTLCARWRTFCSRDCVHAWKLRSQPGYAAQQVLKRDSGVCAECGRDCVALARELDALARSIHPGVVAPWQRAYVAGHMLVTGPYADRCRELGLTGSRAFLRRRLWDMDHIVPVVEGGGSCGLDNLRTLCWACHGRATAELRRRLAARKRGARS